jgi:membrane protein YqaA with SNARE-associated domain
LGKLYHKVLSAAAHRHAKWWLALVSFIESSIFIIPPDVMIIPMVLADRAKWWRIALTATIASVVGGIGGYLIGVFLFDSLGQSLLEFYSNGDKFRQYIKIYEEWGGWAVFGAGLTPFPYKVITVASGVAKLDLTLFIFASLIARGLRFFWLAGLLFYFGESIKKTIEKYFGPITILFFILIFACLLVMNLLFE